ncbi:MAG: carboxymuconolactone decarboxylase family protein [Burkholderiales bacterium]|nr:carboxymuconolactone decarboxylase family protein [Burkholderiales bacterium]
MKTLMTAAAIAAASMGAPAGAAEPAGEGSSGPRWQINRAGARPVNAAPEQNFTGSAKVEMLYTPATPERTSAGSVSFMPGARTAWHTHPLGQALVVTAGAGRVQRDGGPVEEIHVGDVVHIPPNTRHWHGAAPDSAMTHIAITEAQDGKSVDWLEKVSDAQYAVAPAAVVLATVPQTQGQTLFGDIAPKFGQLTDEVLFGDVWGRPGLSPRDRSLITVSALIAMNRPDQLRGHLARARSNGLSDAQLIEAMTHLAFYAGWPSAVTAIGVAREVFKTPHP